MPSGRGLGIGLPCPRNPAFFRQLKVVRTCRLASRKAGHRWPSAGAPLDSLIR